MYCQKCGAQNMDAMRFCRSCGSSMTPQVALPTQPRPSPNYERAFKKLFMGVAFLLLAFIPLFSHGHFWWWMLFPAAGLLAKGMGELMRGRAGQDIAQRELKSVEARGEIVPPVEGPRGLPQGMGSELAPPASVTEDETRRLNPADKKRP